MHTKTNIAASKQNHAENSSQKKNASAVLSLPAVSVSQLMDESNKIPKVESMLYQVKSLPAIPPLQKKGRDGQNIPAHLTTKVIQRKINSGRIGEAYENDMLTGGGDTIKINVNRLWALWDPQQRDNNIHQPAVEEYKVVITSENGHIDAPFLDSIKLNEEEEDSGVIIRSSEGRHRIYAAHEANLNTIFILKPSEEGLSLLGVMGINDFLA